jgi:hypothetical protein
MNFLTSMDKILECNPSKDLERWAPPSIPVLNIVNVCKSLLKSGAKVDQGKLKHGFSDIYDVRRLEETSKKAVLGPTDQIISACRSRHLFDL